MLLLDSIRRTQDGDIDGALESIRAILGTARAIGDEPFAISQLIRAADGSVALSCTERALGQGEASDPSLALLQEAFATEAADRSFVNGLRGERGMLFDFYSKLESGVLSFDDPGDVGSGNDGKSPRRANPYMNMVYRYSRAWSLEFMNRVVEVARQPLPEQPALWDELLIEIEQVNQGPRGELLKTLDKSASMMIPAFDSAWQTNHRLNTRLNAAVVLLACERFRIANGDWPDSPEQLLPFLPNGEMPLDPYTGEPILFARLEDGIVAYGLGSDLIDDGGWLHEFHIDEYGHDLGIRLWNVDLRRQPPEAEPDDMLETELSPDEPLSD